MCIVRWHDFGVSVSTRHCLFVDGPLTLVALFPTTLSFYRHGRVAMLAVLGFVVTEAPIEYHPLFEAAEKDIGPAIRHLDEVRAVAPAFFEILSITIGALELNRALKGWTPPGEVYESDMVLKEDYYPGDVGFDPLGLKPSDPQEFATMATKELQNG